VKVGARSELAFRYSTLREPACGDAVEPFRLGGLFPSRAAQVEGEPWQLGVLSEELQQTACCRGGQGGGARCVVEAPYGALGLGLGGELRLARLQAMPRVARSLRREQEPENERSCSSDELHCEILLLFKGDSEERDGQLVVCPSPCHQGCHMFIGAEGRYSVWRRHAERDGIGLRGLVVILRGDLSGLEFRVRGRKPQRLAGRACVADGTNWFSD